jgi:hypothetical protein
MDRAAPVKANRYVRVRCPVCNEVSPICDQQQDVRRELLFSWWGDHRRRRHPLRPIIEAVEVSDA